MADPFHRTRPSTHRALWRIAVYQVALVLIGIAAMGCGDKTSQTLRPEPSNPDQVDSPPTQNEDNAGSKENTDNTDTAAGQRDRQTVIANAKRLADEQKFAAAATELRELLVTDPNDFEVLFRLAAMEAGSGNLPQAILLLDGIPEDHADAGLPALGQSADWCFQLGRFEDAQQRYRKIVARVPQAARALRQLAFILNRQGRRHEAAQFIRRLCEQGNVRQDELHSLVALNDAMYDKPDSANPTAQRINNENKYWPIGVSGQARKQFSDHKFDEAVTLLHQPIADGKMPPSVVAFYGLAAAEAQDDAKFLWWLNQTNDQTREFAEYWSAVGVYSLNQQRFKEAVRSFAEAVKRDPTDLRSMGRLRQALIVLEDESMAQKIADRWTKVRDSVRANNRVAQKNPPSSEAISELVSLLNELNRPLEALLWQALENHYRGAPPATRTALNQKMKQLVASGNVFSSETQRLCGLEISRYPIPNIETDPASAGDQSPNAIAVKNANPTPAKLQNVADKINLNHTYHVASKPVAHTFSVYQMLGGGVAVLDFDLDGGSDLYFAQGGSDPPAFQGKESNQLFRNSDSTMVDVTENSLTSETQYSIGVTAGDWNQDGFPDIAVTNIGVDVLLINNGDGTFRRRTIATVVDKTRVPSSIAMADLTGNGLPEIYVASYVDDVRMTTKPPTDESGRPRQPILPSVFQTSADWVIDNDGAGGFQSRRLTSNRSQDSTSLGVVITNFDDKPGNEIFVANDMNPNQFWVQTTAKNRSDAALLRGCGFSYTGAATASMGVAASDFENNGTLDLHITNYQDESVSLYLGRDNVFRDRNIQFKLAKPSASVLGFGTQAIDYDNDGRRDLAVTNGHIDDAVENTAPLRQPPQLFCNLGEEFHLADVTDQSGYWNSTHVGRGLATLDFDRDGMTDILITHIGQPSVLLVNQTATKNHWLQIRLVGTTNERDGVGARVRIRTGEREFTDWVIAGNGYLCRNENIVTFGLGQSANVDQILIDWPNGNQQIIQATPADRRLLIVEGDSEPYVLFE